MTDEPQFVLKNTETKSITRIGTKQFMEQLRRNFNSMYQTDAWIVEPYEKKD